MSICRKQIVRYYSNKRYRLFMIIETLLAIGDEFAAHRAEGMVPPVFEQFFKRSTLDSERMIFLTFFLRICLVPPKNAHALAVLKSTFYKHSPEWTTFTTELHARDPKYNSDEDEDVEEEKTGDDLLKYGLIKHVNQATLINAVRMLGEKMALKSIKKKERNFN
eukprot:TRINITY_DN21043_c0_g1_i1.p1 TRINITY_DN21043_c0_g1~~TRINITY_DN21043_c0_g1_i1.p1  ORF type:complete len:164 (-),score=26.58 TRINITY_DN21043_c0_g1_i1:8-499(-)